MNPGGGPNGGGEGPSIDDLTASVPGDYVQLRYLNGSVVTGKEGFVPQFAGATSGPKPKLPKTIAVPAGSSTQDRVVFFTVPAVSGDGKFRVRASIEVREPNRILVIATPLSEADSTLHQLLLVELLVTALVLAAIGGLGLWVVRLGLRPLAAIGDTAAAIASGDLSQRVERAEPRTEVGRLGIALNVDADADRVVAARARGVRAQAPALRRRRLPRAAHSARGRAGLCRAVRARRGHPARRSRPLDARHRARVGSG